MTVALPGTSYPGSMVHPAHSRVVTRGPVFVA